MPPAQHFVRKGVYAGAWPNPSFDPAAYLIANPDVAVSGMNPLVHHHLHGRKEGRRVR